uniref:B-cell receptor-associated protein n=1 Tax=Felis catus TaxID=9685 RepID=A0ABI7VTN6_FELCA
MVWEQASEAVLSLLSKHFVVETPCTKRSLSLFPRGARKRLPRSCGWPGPVSQVCGTRLLCYCWSRAFSSSPLLPSGNIASAGVAVGGNAAARDPQLPPICHSLVGLDLSLLRRLVTLISQQATLLASNEAFKKQAESASEAAKKYMEENDQLKKEAAAGGVKLDGRDAEEKVGEENRSLKAELKKLKDELDISKQKLEKAENEALAMRKQSEGLTKEYDRLLEEHAKLQAAVDGPTDKKEE